MNQKLIALIAWGMFATAVVAQDGGPPGGKGKPFGIDPAEAQKRMQKMLDTNGDGRVDEGEMRAAQEKMTQAFNSGLVPEDVKRRADRNGDGKLDPQEIAALQQHMARMGKGGNVQYGAGGNGQGGGISDDILKKFDKNGDGRLDEAETKAAQEASKPKSRMQQLKEKLDTNGDGKIDDSERAAAKEAFKNRSTQKKD